MTESTENSVTVRANDELCAFPVMIEPSKSSVQILWLLLENTHHELKLSNEKKPESERAKIRVLPST
jgi:hypothetical protein